MKKRTNIQPPAMRGFTLLEMAIAVAVVGLIASIAVPNIISQMPTRKLNETVWNLNAKIRLARTKSMSFGAVTTMSYDAGTRTFTFWTDENGDTVMDNSEVMTNTVESTYGISIYTYPSTKNKGQFNPDGSFTGSNPYFNIGLMILQADRAKFKYWVYVWPTGLVTVKKYVYL